MIKIREDGNRTSTQPNSIIDHRHLCSLKNIDKEMENLPLASTSYPIGKCPACDRCEDNSNTVKKAVADLFFV